MPEAVRLSKRLIELTGCSRREAELYIEGGWVTVDGQVVDSPQLKINEQRVALREGAVAVPCEPVTLLFNVPAGHCATSAAEHIGAANHWPEDGAASQPLQRHFSRLNSCIPLQAGADGLHVLTQDWRIERKLREDLSRLEQEYVIEFSGLLSEQDLKRLNRETLQNGRPLPRCKVSRQSETRLRFALKNPQPGQLVWLCQSVGLQVLGLKRIRVGGVPMAKVPSGQWRYLGDKERF